MFRVLFAKAVLQLECEPALKLLALRSYLFSWLVMTKTGRILFNMANQQSENTSRWQKDIVRWANEKAVSYDVVVR